MAASCIRFNFPHILISGIVGYCLPLIPFPNSFNMLFSALDFDQGRQFDNSFFSARFETAPLTDVLFRPEEIHGASAIGKVLEPFPERYRCVADHTFRLGLLDQAVFHLHPEE
jgi:hypothetical protein